MNKRIKVYKISSIITGSLLLIVAIFLFIGGAAQASIPIQILPQSTQARLLQSLLIAFAFSFMIGISNLILGFINVKLDKAETRLLIHSILGLIFSILMVFMIKESYYIYSLTQYLVEDILFFVIVSLIISFVSILNPLYLIGVNSKEVKVGVESQGIVEVQKTSVDNLLKLESFLQEGIISKDEYFAFLEKEKQKDKNKNTSSKGVVQIENLKNLLEKGLINKEEYNKLFMELIDKTKF